MAEIPSRAKLAEVWTALSSIAPSPAFGVARPRGPGRLSVLYCYQHGFGEFVLPEQDLPDGWSFDAAPDSDVDLAALQAHHTRAFEGFLLHNGVQRLISLPTSRGGGGTRLWAGLADAAGPAGEVRSQLRAMAGPTEALLDRPLTPLEAAERLRRLELAAELLPALLHVLDVRQVFERLSAAARASLPHDQLLMFLFEEGLTSFRVFARTDRGDVDRVLPNPYPPDSIRVWGFSIIDDHLLHPLEKDAPATKLGGRSSIRLPITFDERVIGGIAFVAKQPALYTSEDIPIGRRLADHVATALSHHQLAEQLVEQARRAEELRARTTNLELLDQLLDALVDEGEIGEVFERVTAIAAKVLPHDAAALLVHLPDGRRGRVYASKGYPTDLPETIEIPEEVRQNPNWEHDIFDDVSQLKGAIPALLTRIGFRSLLRVPIRLEGRIAGFLTFCGRSIGFFKAENVLVAHRMADRLALTLVRDRELAALKKADEATVRAARLEARVQALTDELDARTGFRRVVGTSRPWRLVLTQATQVAATESTVLLLGESGTGKEVVARFVHRASGRKGGPFIAINCAALPDQLLEAELFGYERGAYTGAVQSKPGQIEQAAGGTLFLDEVGEMSLSAQAKFLRVLQEREFQRLGGTRVLRADVRIVAATNRDLPRSIATGQFREDLFYRLNVFAIRLPSLRDRRDDVLELSDAFLAEIGRGLGRAPAGISRDARKLLVEYEWPGNVRELRNILERAAILCDGGLITAEHLAFNPARPAPAAGVTTAAAVSDEPNGRAVAGAATSPSSAADLHALERGMIADALQAARFNKSRAAKALGLTRHQLYIRMRKHGLE